MSALRSRLRKAAEAAEDQPLSPTDDAFLPRSPPIPTTRRLPSLEQKLLQGDDDEGGASSPPRAITIQSSEENNMKHRHSTDSSVSGLTASPYARQETENMQHDYKHHHSSSAIPVTSSTSAAPDSSQCQRGKTPPIRHPSDEAFHSSNSPGSQIRSPPAHPSNIPSVGLTVHHVRQPTQLPNDIHINSPLSSPVALLSDDDEENGGGYDDTNTRLDSLLHLSPHAERANPLVEGAPTPMTGANIAMAYHRYKRYQSMSWEATNVVWDFLDTFDKIKRELERMDQEESSDDEGSYSSLTSSIDGAICDRAQRRKKATRKVPMGRNSGSQERSKSIVAVFDRVTGREGLSGSHQATSARIGSVSTSSGRGGGGGKLGATTATTTTTSVATPTSSSTLATAPDSPPHWTLPTASHAASSSSSGGPSAVGSSRSVFLARTMLASIESLRMNMEPYKPLRGLALRGMELRNELTELQANVSSASSSVTSSVSSVKRSSIGRLRERSNTELKDMLHRIVRVSVGLPGLPTVDECDEGFDAEADDAMWSADQYDDLELMRAASAFGHERRNSHSISRRFGPPRHNSNTDTHSAIGSSNMTPPPPFRNNSGARNGSYTLDEIPGMGELASSVLLSPGVGDYSTTGTRGVSFTAANKRGIDPPSPVRRSVDAGNGGEDVSGVGGRSGGGFASRKEGSQRSFKLTFLGEQALTEHHAQDYTSARGKPRRPTSAETTLSIVSATTARPVREHDRLNKEDDEALGTMYIGRLNVLQALGKGAQGEVKLVQDLLEIDPRTNQPPLMAMKIVKRKMFSTLAHTREIAVMKQLRHKNIIRLREVIQDPSVKEVYLLMDYAGRGPVAHLRQPRVKGRGRSTHKSRNKDDSSASQTSSSDNESSSPSTSDDSDDSNSSASPSPSPKRPNERRSLIPPAPQSPLRLLQKSSGIIGFDGDEDQLWCMPLKPSAVLEVANQVIRALRYLHKKQIAHRDIKPDNVLVHTDGRICLADFGVSEMLNEVDVSDDDDEEYRDEKKDSSNNLTESTTTIKSRVSNDTVKGGGGSTSVRSDSNSNLLPNNLLNLQIPGTRHFHAPELLGFKPASLTLLKYNGTSPTSNSLNNSNGSRPSSKSKEENSSVVFCYGDIWSVGVMLAFLLFGKPPFDGNNATSLQNNILHEDPTFPDNADELLQFYEIYGRLPAETKRDHYNRIKKECGNRKSPFEPNTMSASDNTSSSTRSLNQYPVSSPLNRFGNYLNNTTTSQDGSTTNKSTLSSSGGAYELSSSARSSSSSFKEVASWGLWKEVLGGLLTKDPTKRMTLADVRNSKLFALANDGKVSERRASAVVAHGVSVLPASGSIGSGNDESTGGGARKRVGKGFADFKKVIVPTTATSHSSRQQELTRLNSTGNTSGDVLLDANDDHCRIHEDESDTQSDDEEQNDGEGGGAEGSSSTAEGRVGSRGGQPTITDRDVVQAIKIVTRSSELFSRKKPAVTLFEKEDARSATTTSPNQLMETVSPHTGLPRDGGNLLETKTSKSESNKADVLSDTRTSLLSDGTSTNLTSTTNSDQKRKDKSSRGDKKAKKAKDRENETPEEKRERKRIKKGAKHAKQENEDTLHDNSHSHLVDFRNISDGSATLLSSSTTAAAAAVGRRAFPAMAGVVSPVGASTVASLEESYGSGAAPPVLSRQDSVYTLGRGNSTVRRRGVGGAPVSSQQSFAHGSFSINSSSINAAHSSTISTTTKALPSLGVVVDTPSSGKTPAQPPSRDASPPIATFSSVLNSSQNGPGTPGSGLDDPFFASIISDSPANSGLTPPTFSPKATGSAGLGGGLGAISPVARLGWSVSGANAASTTTSTTPASGPSPLFSRLRPGSDSTGPSIYASSTTSTGGGLFGRALQSSVALKSPAKRDGGAGGVLGTRSQSSLHTRTNTNTTLTSTTTVSATPPGNRTTPAMHRGGASSVGGVPLQHQHSSGTHEASPPSVGSIRVRRRLGQGSLLNGATASLMLAANDLETSQGSSSASISSNNPSGAPNKHTHSPGSSPSHNSSAVPLQGFSPPLSATRQGSSLPAPLTASGTYSRPLFQPSGGVHHGSPALLPSPLAVRRSGSGSGSRGRNLPSLSEGSERDDSMLRGVHPTPPSGSPPTQLGRAPSLKNSQA